jgi:NAD(P)H-flavin reductase
MPPSVQNRVARFVGYSDLTPAVARLTFDCEGLEWIPGQYIELTDPTGPATQAAFSVASLPSSEVPGRFEIAAARGSSAQFLFDLTAGDELELSGPRGKFVFRSAPGAPVTLVGAGTGLAPLRALLLDALAKQGAAASLVSPRFLIVFGARALADLIWADEFRALAADPRLLSYQPTLSQPPSDWTGLRGYVQAHLASLLHDRRDGDVYVCGPSAMVTACVAVLTAQLGISSQRIYTEGH